MNKKRIKLKCRSCFSENFTSVLNLGSFYLSDFRTNKRSNAERKYPLEIILCNNCNLLQLRETVPPKKLYTERYGYRSGINSTMRKELSDIVKNSVKKVAIKEGDLVVDIGSNDGTLLSFYPKKIKKMAVEPVKKFANESKKIANYVVNDFFSFPSIEKAYKAHNFSNKAKIITSISMFYDLEHPNKFLEDIISLLHPDGIFVIQQNYLLNMLRLNAFDNIVHEHLEYYSIHSLQNLLTRHKLRIFDAELSDINGGSFRVYMCLDESKRKTSQRLKKLEKEENNYNLKRRETYKEFGKRATVIKNKVKKFLETENRNGKKIYIYGASTRGNTVLQFFKLNNKLLRYAVERNPEKWGKYVTSINLPIISEEEARNNLPDYMLILPWFFKEEFIKREMKFLKNGGTMIFPLPMPQLISYKNKKLITEIL